MITRTVINDIFDRTELVVVRLLLLTLLILDGYSIIGTHLNSMHNDHPPAYRNGQHNQHHRDEHRPRDNGPVISEIPEPRPHPDDEHVGETILLPSEH